MNYAKQSGYDMKTLEGRRAFVFDGWRELAGHAYGAYMQNGRGALVIAGDLGGPDMQRPKWLTPDTAAQLNEELAAAIAEYDPENEIVVMFELRDFANAFARYEVDDCPPPAAYADLGAGDKKH